MWWWGVKVPVSEGGGELGEGGEGEEDEKEENDGRDE